MTSLGSNAGAMNARGVRNVAKYFASGAIDHHHVRCTGDEHAPRGGFDGHIVGAALALDVELFNLERLCGPDFGRDQADCKEGRKCGPCASAHKASVVVA